jgi:hypothetical protein
MTIKARERMLDALDRAGMLWLQVKNDRHWPARAIFLALLAEYMQRLERRLQGV